MMNDKTPEIDLDFSKPAKVIQETIGNSSSSNAIKSVKDFIDRLEKDVKKEFERDKEDVFFYRGQANTDWKLEPKLFREKEFYTQEHQIIRDLRARQAKDFSNDRIMFDYLVRAQHYGLPTRLLDVTRNPLIALYFACSDDKELEENGKIFIFKRKTVEIEYFDSEKVSLLSNLAILSEKEKLEINKKGANTLKKLHIAVRHEKSGFKGENNETSKILKKPCFVMPRQNNDRIIAQQGAFVLLGLRDKTTDEINSGLDIFKSYEISSSHKGEILKELEILGIHEHSVYPDLEHCANYLMNNLKRLRIDADRGNAQSQFEYGMRCYQGYRSKQNFEEAKKYFKKADKQNHAEAQFYLGLMYAKGEGVEQDFQKARIYFEKAAKQNNVKAQNNLGIMYYTGKDVKQDFEKARKYWEEASKSGHASAQFNLGLMYANGNGVEQDFQKARIYFEKAAAQGLQRAKEALKKLDELEKQDNPDKPEKK